MRKRERTVRLEEERNAPKTWNTNRKIKKNDKVEEREGKRENSKEEERIGSVAENLEFKREDKKRKTKK